MTTKVAPSRYFILKGKPARIVLAPAIANQIREDKKVLFGYIQEYLNLMALEQGVITRERYDELTTIEEYDAEQDVAALLNEMPDEIVAEASYVLDHQEEGIYLTLDDMIDEMLSTKEKQAIHEAIAHIMTAHPTT